MLTFGIQYIENLDLTKRKIYRPSIILLVKSRVLVFN